MPITVLSARSGSRVCRPHIRQERKDDMSIVTQPSPINNLFTGGVDTHADVHVAAVIDQAASPDR